MNGQRFIFLLYFWSDPVFAVLDSKCPPAPATATASLSYYENEDSALSGEHPKCIYAFGYEKDQRSWDESEAFCNTLMSTSGVKGTLVSVHSIKEDNAIGEAIRDGLTCPSDSKKCNERRFWMGLRKHCKNCDFSWNDYSPYDFQYFESDGEIGQHECAYIDTYDQRNWWQDENCWAKYRFICQIEPDGPRDPPNIENAPGGCDQGWWEYHGTCYRSFGSNLTGRPETHSNEIADQATAIAKCNSLGATLAIFPNRFHNDFASAFLYAEGDSPWIGVVSDTEQGLKYMWYDRSQLTYSNWQPGYPEQGTGKRCVKMWYFSSHSIGWDLGTWENRGCSEKRPYLCSKKADPMKPQQQAYYNPYECPDGWIPHESSCFKLVNQAAAFDAAQANCASNSDKKWVGNVVTVWNVYQQKLLNSFFNSDDAMPSTDKMWLGLKAEQGSDGSSVYFKWVDGMYDSFTNFALGEPALVNSNSCFYISKEGQLGQWYATSACNQPLPYVCKLELKEALPNWDEKDKRGEVIPCTEPWKTYGHHCYRPHKYGKSSWATAEGVCQEMDRHAHLVAIHSDRLNSFIQNMARDEWGEDSRVWIGAERYQNGDVDSFKWSNNDAFSYTHWAQGEPNDWNERNEDCVSMYVQNGFWNDDICDAQYNGICMKRAQQENCVVSQGEHRDYCGYPGISEQECWSQFKCCYYHNRCYYPDGSSAKKNGLTPGGAAGLTFFMFLTFFFIPIAFYLYKKNGVNLSMPQ